MIIHTTINAQKVSTGSGPTPAKENKDQITLKNSRYIQPKPDYEKDVGNSVTRKYNIYIIKALL